MPLLRPSASDPASIKTDGVRHGERGAAKGRKVGIVELSSEAGGPWDGLSKVGRTNCCLRRLRTSLKAAGRARIGLAHSKIRAPSFNVGSKWNISSRVWKSLNALSNTAIPSTIPIGLKIWKAMLFGLCWSHRGVHLGVEGKRCCIDSCIQKEEVRVARLTTCTRVSCRVGILSRSPFWFT
jgi:hypothetical protein